METDVAVIGGGINGCAIAYNLAKRGIDVVLLERNFLSSGATGRCAGGIRQQFTSKNNIRLAMESVKIFEKFEKEFACDIEFEQGGYLVLAHSEQEEKEFKENMHIQKTMGLDVKFLENDEIKELLPFLNLEKIGAIGATFCPTDGHANPLKVADVYASSARELGAEIHTFTEVKNIKIKKEKFLIKTSRNETDNMRADVIVNAAGGYSNNIAKMVGVELPNKPYRHEILATEPLKHFLYPVIISFHDEIYFLQQKHGEIVGGISNPDEPCGPNISSSLEFLKRMARTLTRYIPAFNHLNIVRQWAGLYDTTPDALPILGPVDEIPNFINVNGFSGHGFMISPIVGELIAELISEGKTALPLDDFALSRFKGKIIEKETSVVG